MQYRVVLYRSEEGYAVSCPALPGCLSQGSTREEALSNIREAIQLWLEVDAEQMPEDHNEDGVTVEQTFVTI